MRHTSHLRALLLVPFAALALVACGDDSPAAAPGATDTLPPIATTPAYADVTYLVSAVPQVPGRTC